MPAKNTYSDPELCKELLNTITRYLDRIGRPIRFMEVCGTHTVSIFRSGLRSLLPQALKHLSGPGCPVCVTHESEVSAFLRAAQCDNVILAAFGDLLRVPDASGNSLLKAQSQGSKVRIVYSPLDAVKLAAENPHNLVVFPSVGFETTAPAIAASLITAKKQGIGNFCILPCNKLVPPVMQVLLTERKAEIDAFLLPGHVAVILGLQPFAFISEKYRLPAVVGGFEPADILSALCLMLKMICEGKPAIGNTYKRVVDANGSSYARDLLNSVFMPSVALWRGLGEIPLSGLALREEWESFNAYTRLSIPLEKSKPIPGCRCGDILRGLLSPNQCPLFGKKCTPQNPVGPCMVSTEGSCAAWYHYNLTV